MTPRKETEPTKEQAAFAAEIIGHVWHQCPTECPRCDKVSGMAVMLARRDESRDAALLKPWREAVERGRNALLSAQEAFVELWGVSSGAEEKFIDDTEALEWVDKFSQTHDVECQKAIASLSVHRVALLSQPAAEEPCDDERKNCGPCLSGRNCQRHPEVKP